MLSYFQGHSWLFTLAIYDRPYDFLLVFHFNYVTIRDVPDIWFQMARYPDPTKNP